MSEERVVESAIARIRGIDPAWIEKARARQLELTKPPGSLGRLEVVANRLAAIQETLRPDAGRPRIVLFAADHGVCAERVNPYPQDVTAQMVSNFLRGGAAINALASAVDADLEVIDMGVAGEIQQMPGLLRRVVARGTKNFCVEAAMTREEAAKSLAVGIERADEAVASGSKVIGIGEMGIGNTTVASALAAVLTGRDAGEVTGRGTGADDSCVARKRSAVERAVSRHASGIKDPLDLLARLGGFEIGAMCGVCLGAAANRCAIVMDGFIATAAAALAVRFCGAVADYLLAGHLSPEPGHAALLALLGEKPLLDLGMRLGEGTGAALAMPLVRAAVKALTEMATFASAGVSGGSAY